MLKENGLAGGSHVEHLRLAQSLDERATHLHSSLIHFLGTAQYSAGSTLTPLQMVDVPIGFKARSGEDGRDLLLYKTAFVIADGPA